MRIPNRIKAAFRKNQAPLRTFLSGNYPGFVYGKKILDCIPVFVFHQVDDSFEKILIHLKENNYSTLHCDELTEHSRSTTSLTHHRKVVLTFDDGHISLWRHAYPLLKKYGEKCVSFICPGLVPNKDEISDDNRTLCDWPEIRHMHHSGIVDFQSHGMCHDLVFQSDRLLDFFNPDFTSHYLGKIENAVVLKNDPHGALTNLWPNSAETSADYFGLPVFELAPRLAADKRFKVDPEIIARICDIVCDQDGRSFFEARHWRSVLKKQLAKAGKNGLGKIISGRAYQNDVTRDLLAARATIEKELPGKEVRHLCYPWYNASRASLETALACGHQTAFLGMDAYLHAHRSASEPTIIQRLPEKFIYLLPGEGRKSL